MSARIRVGVVDHHPLFRAGVIHTLSMAGDCDVVGEGAGLNDALQIAADHAPDILLLNVHDDFSEEGVRRLTTGFPAMRTLVFTVIADEGQVVAALKAGASGYMLKGASGAELVESIRRVHRGESYLDPSLAAKLFTMAIRREGKPNRSSTLTVREEQVWECLTRGLTNKNIARQLNLSEKTVKHYVTELFEKLNVRNRVEAALLGTDRARNSLARPGRSPPEPA
jgi:two-component system, NarL family, nitrate/nitrite response regulator NarL